MNRFNSVSKPAVISTTLLLFALAAGCGGGGGRDPILGAPVAPISLIDKIRPRVTITVPLTPNPDPTLVAPTNAAIIATFTENMAPATINATSFTVVNTTLGGTAVPGLVTYSNGSRTAVYKPTDPLTLGSTYTARIKGIDASAATDLSGNALAGNTAALPAASDYVWTFTASAPDTAAPTVTLTFPVNGATEVGVNSSVNATFSEAMDPFTIIAATFTLQASGPPMGPILAGVTAFNPATRTVTLTPSNNLTANTQYTATVTNGAKDLAGNALVVPAIGVPSNPWTFTTGTGLVTGAAGLVPLGSAGSFGIMATSAITNTGAGTIINGDVSLEPGSSNGLLPVQVNGSIHINDSVSHQARADLLTAYNSAKNLAPGITVPGGQNLGAFSIPGGGLPGVLPPGTYTSGSTMDVNTNLTLDAGGNANAVWVFQIGSSLTTTAGGNVVLSNGAQAKNVFWVPTLDATVGVGTIFYGTLVSGRDVTAKTGATINGRILAGATLAGTIALDTNTVNVPTP